MSCVQLSEGGDIHRLRRGPGRSRHCTINGNIASADHRGSFLQLQASCPSKTRAQAQDILREETVWRVHSACRCDLA